MAKETTNTTIPAVQKDVSTRSNIDRRWRVVQNGEFSCDFSGFKQCDGEGREFMRNQGVVGSQGVLMKSKIGF